MNKFLKPLTNIDFDNLLKDNKYYAGCFSKDLVSSKSCKDGYLYVLNLDAAGGSGSHWIMMSLADKDTNLYFDSYSAPPPLKVQNFLKKQSKPYIINPLYEAEQSLNSSSCGYFCLFLILLQTKLKYSPQDCIDFFRDKIGDNEEFINIFSKEVLKKLKTFKE
jgi:hypothetical protein